MITKDQMKANEEHFNNALRVIKDGGTYVWRDYFEIYGIVNKKFVPTTPRGYELIKEIVTPEWLQSHVSMSIFALFN